MPFWSKMSYIFVMSKLNMRNQMVIVLSFNWHEDKKRHKSLNGVCLFLSGLVAILNGRKGLSYGAVTLLNLIYTPKKSIKNWFRMCSLPLSPIASSFRRIRADKRFFVFWLS